MEARLTSLIDTVLVTYVVDTVIVTYVVDMVLCVECVRTERSAVHNGL